MKPRTGLFYLLGINQSMYLSASVYKLGRAKCSRTFQRYYQDIWDLLLDDNDHVATPSSNSFETQHIPQRKCSSKQRLRFRDTIDTRYAQNVFRERNNYGNSAPKTKEKIQFAIIVNSLSWRIYICGVTWTEVSSTESTCPKFQLPIRIFL